MVSKPFLEKLLDIVCTTIFLYLLLDSLIVLEIGGEASRIDLLGFLIPHASKIALYSALALLWLRPRFGWRYPFAMFAVYCGAEATTNMIYLAVHLQNIVAAFRTPGYNLSPYEIFFVVQLFFASGLALGYIVLRGKFSLKADWSMLPWIFFVGSWVYLGYQTEATISYPSYFLEFQEFMWNLLWVLMVTQVFKSKVDLTKEPNLTSWLRI